MNKGDKVTIVGTTLVGEVSTVKFDENTGEKRVFVTWINAEGEEHTREFAANQIAAAVA